MTPDDRLDLWVEWYQANRPRHEGAADVQRQLAFALKALDGVLQCLLVLRERQRGENTVIVPRLVGRL